MSRRALAAAVVIVALGSAPAFASPPRVITAADSGKTVVVRRGAQIALRLSGPWIWGVPRTPSASVGLTPVEYFVYPGYQQWTVAAVRVGRATITVTGRRTNAPPRLFRVTLLVRR